MKTKLLKFALPILTIGAVSAPIASLTSCNTGNHLQDYIIPIDFFKERDMIADVKIRLKNILADFNDVEVEVDYKNVTGPKVLGDIILTDREVTSEEFIPKLSLVHFGMHVEGLRWPDDDPSKIKEGEALVIPLKLRCYNTKNDKTIWTEYAKIKFVHRIRLIEPEEYSVIALKDGKANFTFDFLEQPDDNKVDVQITQQTLLPIDFWWEENKMFEVIDGKANIPLVQTTTPPEQGITFFALRFEFKINGKRCAFEVRELDILWE